MGLHVLERGNRHGNTVRIALIRITDQARVQEMGEPVIDEAVLRHVDRLGKQLVLPGAVGVGLPHDPARVLELLRALDDPAVAAEALEARHAE